MTRAMGRWSPLNKRTDPGLLQCCTVVVSAALVASLALGAVPSHSRAADAVRPTAAALVGKWDSRTSTSCSPSTGTRRRSRSPAEQRVGVRASWVASVVRDPFQCASRGGGSSSPPSGASGGDPAACATSAGSNARPERSFLKGASHFFARASKGEARSERSNAFVPPPDRILPSGDVVDSVHPRSCPPDARAPEGHICWLPGPETPRRYSESSAVSARPGASARTAPGAADDAALTTSSGVSATMTSPCSSRRSASSSW